MEESIGRKLNPRDGKECCPYGMIEKRKDVKLKAELTRESANQL